MQSQYPQNELSGADQELESALSRLAPATPGIDARTLLLAAERARMARRIWAYRAVAAILAVALLISLFTRPKPVAPETVRAVLIPAPAPPATVMANAAAAPPAALMEELEYCQKLMATGLAALPDPPPRAAGPLRPDPPLIGANPLWN